MTTPSGSVRANLVDITARRVFAAEIGWSAGVIGRIDELGAANPAWPCLISFLVYSVVLFSSPPALSRQFDPCIFAPCTAKIAESGLSIP